MGEGRAPAYRQVVALAGQYGVAENELEMMIDEVAATVERWPEFARVKGGGQCGDFSAAVCDTL